MMLSASVGAYVGYLSASQSQAISAQQKFLSLWPLLFLGIAVVSLWAWWRRGVSKDKEDARIEERSDNSQRMLSEIHSALIPAPAPEEVAAIGLDAARRVGTSIWVSPGNTFTMAAGAGPAKITVPSGGMFGLGSPETVEFTLDNRQHSLILPLGGTVTLLASGTGHAEVTGIANGTVEDPSDN